MKTKSLIFLVATLIIGGCKQMSESEIDESAGLNGGFEVSKNGLPVNWRIYSPDTVPNADFQILLDEDVFKEGKKSLRFDVEKCASVGGWRSPGFTNEFFEIGKFMGEGRYKLSFWVRNDGAEFQVSAGGVSAMEGNMSVLINENEKIDDWQLFEYTIEIPKDRWLRIEVNILQPGTFWIDGIRIEKVEY